MLWSASSPLDRNNAMEEDACNASLLSRRRRLVVLNHMYHHKTL